MAALFDDPDVTQVFIDLFDRIFHETGRGAIIIAASYVEEHLAKLIVSILPKMNHKNLFKYPGQLSTFSAKVELSYAFRLIDKHLYERLTALRKIRNDAAHSSVTFSLKELKPRLTEVYDITEGQGMATHIHNLAVEMMVKSKVQTVHKFFDQYNLTDDERAERAKSIFAQKEVTDKLEEQVPHWELLVGITFLCGLISSHKRYLTETISGRNTWGLDRPNIEAQEVRGAN